MRVFSCDQCGRVLAIGGDTATASPMTHPAGESAHAIAVPSVDDFPWHVLDEEITAWLDAHPGSTAADLRAAFPMPAGWSKPTETIIEPAVRDEPPRVRREVEPSNAN